jgi:predicted transcriptional regulator
MSIRPQWATAIFAGAKTVELRRRRIAADTAYVLVYVTAPVSRIVGWFSVGNVIVASPTTVWRRWGRRTGLDRSAYNDYFRNASEAVAILIEEVVAYPRPLALTSCAGVARAPQSYQYLPQTAVPMGASLTARLPQDCELPGEVS